MKIKQYLKSNYKKFQMHFLEFLMLFFAVFLGFLADNFRDNTVERKNEKELMESLLEDIKVDKKNIQETIELNKWREQRLDSLSNLCFNYTSHKNDAALYEQYEVLNGEPFLFIPNEQTLSQLNYSGGLSLITSRKVIRQIFKYEHRKKELKKQQQYQEEFNKNVVNLGLQIFSQYPYKQKKSYRKRTGLIWKEPYTDKLLTNDTALIKEFANKVYLYQSAVNYYHIILKQTIDSADNLTDKLKKEYNLK